MRIALLSDLHANIEALDACLRHARGQSVGRFAFLGDVVGYGADPGPVVDRVASCCAQGALAVRGNHDQALDDDTVSLTDDAKAVIGWTRGRLDAGQRGFLSSLPLLVVDQDVCFVHASAQDPQLWTYVRDHVSASRSLAATQAVWCVSGHMHDQKLYYQGAGRQMMAFAPSAGAPIPVGRHRRWLAIVGSAGQPRDGNPAAAYAVLDTDQAQIAFFRIPYDHGRAAARIRSEGLPEVFARRIEGAA